MSHSLINHFRMQTILQSTWCQPSQIRATVGRVQQSAPSESRRQLHSVQSSAASQLRGRLLCGAQGCGRLRVAVGAPDRQPHCQHQFVQSGAAASHQPRCHHVGPVHDTRHGLAAVDSDACVPAGHQLIVLQHDIDIVFKYRVRRFCATLLHGRQ